MKLYYFPELDCLIEYEKYIGDEIWFHVDYKNIYKAFYIGEL